MTTRSLFKRLGDIPLWVYPVGLGVIVLLLSFLPGGAGLRALLVPIAGWSATIWFFRHYSWVRTFVYVCLAIILIGVVVLAVLLSGSGALGF